MKKISLRSLLIGVFLILFIILLGVFNIRKPRILVLHSFPKDSPWSTLINQGMRKALKANRNPVSVNFHHLGVDSRQSTESLRHQIQEAKEAIEREKPDVLIAVDDESNHLVAKDYAGRGKPRIVFVAILQPPQSYGYTTTNATGLVEQLPLDAVREAILVARGGQPARIAILAKDDITGRAELEQAKSYAWAPHRLVGHRGENTFEGWQGFISRMADSADVLLVLSYDELKRSAGTSGMVPRGEIVDWIERNSRPLPLGICDTYVQDGGGLSITPAPVDFGEQAMRLALQWIAAGAGSPPPPVGTSHHFRVGLRRRPLAARGVTMSPIYVETARLGDAYFP